MKKIVKLTEADLYRIVNRVLNEQPQTGQTHSSSANTTNMPTRVKPKPGQVKPNPFRPSMKEDKGDDFVMPGQNMKGDFYDKVNMLINEYSDIDKHDILDVLENLSRQIKSEIRRDKSNM